MFPGANNVRPRQASQLYRPLVEEINPFPTDRSRQVYPNGHNQGNHVGQDNVNPLQSNNANMSSERDQGPQRNSITGPNKTRYNKFLVKKNKHTVVQDESDNGIPFSAVKEVYRYQAFVSRLSPHSDVAAMTRYINNKLKVNATLKVVLQCSL